jgi:hypothetical protein
MIGARRAALFATLVGRPGALGRRSSHARGRSR